MCGRFTIGEIKDLLPRFSVESPVADMPRPRYNIAPTQDVPIIIRRSPNQLVMMRWGLIPFWSRDEKIGSKLINARAETVTDRPAFRASVKDKRCLVPTTGFYEWKDTGKGKVPYLARRTDDKLFAMAGLYDHWKDPYGKEVLSFTIITTAANELMADIHDRMPVILSREDEVKWLEPSPPPKDELERLFRPYPSEKMETYAVSKAVNDISKDTIELIRPAEGAKADKWF